MEPVTIAARDQISTYKKYDGDLRYARVQRDVNKHLFQQSCHELGYNQGKLEPAHHASLDDPQVRALFDELSDCLLDADVDLESGSSNPDKTSKLHESNERVTSAFESLHKLDPSDEQDINAFVDLNLRLKKIQAHSASQIESTLAYVKQSIKTDVEDWLGPQWIKETHGDAVPRRLKGTCRWVLELPKFRKWAEVVPKKPNVFWIKGRAGYGKTMVCSKIVDYFLDAEDRHQVAYFLASGSRPLADIFSVVRSWAVQLIMSNDKALDLAASRKSTTGSRSAKKSDVEALLREILQKVPGCTLIVDGLDECIGTEQDWKENGRNPIVRFFEHLENAISGTNTRVMISSRSLAEIQEGLDTRSKKSSWSLTEYQIQPDDVRDDATLYARHVVERKMPRTPDDIRHEVSDFIIEKSNSMFMVIKMIQHHLHDDASLEDVEKMIDRATTSGLDYLYDKSWKRIEKYTISYPRAMDILRWSAFAKRPLTVAELTGSLLVTEDDADLHVTKDDIPTINQDYIRNGIEAVCRGLVEVRGSTSRLASQTVHLAHHTVREYVVPRLPTPTGQILQNERLKKSYEACQQNYLAQKCLRFLQMDEVWEGRENKRETEKNQGSGEEDDDDDWRPILFPFRDHATNWWSFYIHLDTPSTQAVMNQVFVFLTQKKDYFSKWMRLFMKSNKDSYRDFILTPMYFAASHGFVEVVRRLISECHLDVNFNQNSDGRTALYAASLFGHKTMVSFLLINGADMNIPCILAEGARPIHAAAYRGHFEVIRILLEAGADPNTAGLSGQTALFVACGYGRTDICGVLLKHGANASAATKDGYTALMIAAGDGNLDIAKMLLDHGADLSAFNAKGRTALHCAVKSNHLDTTRLLLERGADPSVPISSGRGERPIHLAIQAGQMSMLALLIAKGASVSTPDDEQLQPIHWATREGHTDLVGYLLDKGANAMAKGGDGLMPVHIATVRGHTDIIRLLAQRGAVMEAHGPQGVTPAHSAVMLKKIKTLELLHELDPNIMMSRMDRGSLPIHLALDSESIAIAEFLVQKCGTSLVARDTNGNTPFHEAATRGNTELVKMMLRKVNCGLIDTVNMDDLLHTRNKDMMTPLLGAAQCGRASVVEVLREYGEEAILHEKNRRGSTALHVACGSGHRNVVEVLLQEGADQFLDVENFEGLTPMDLAAEAGHQEVVQFLLHRHEKQRAIMESEKSGSRLYRACRMRSPELVKHYLDAGVNPDVMASESKRGWTPLIRACDVGSSELVELLLKAGADPALPSWNEENGTTPIHQACSEGYPIVVELLIKAGADVNKSSRGLWPLSLSCKVGDSESAKLLLDAGADATVKTEDGFTPLMYAFAYRHWEVVKVLLEHRSGAACETVDTPCQAAPGVAQAAPVLAPIHFAALLNLWGIVKLLLDKGASVNSQTLAGQTNDGDEGTKEISGVGWTALHYAAHNGHQKLVELLLKRGADPSIPIAEGLMPVDCARLKNRTKVIRVLEGKQQQSRRLKESGIDVEIAQILGNNPRQVEVPSDLESEDESSELSTPAESVQLEEKSPDTPPAYCWDNGDGMGVELDDTWGSGMEGVEAELAGFRAKRERKTSLNKACDEVVMQALMMYTLQ